MNGIEHPIGRPIASFWRSRDGRTQDMEVVHRRVAAVEALGRMGSAWTTRYETLAFQRDLHDRRRVWKTRTVRVPEWHGGRYHSNGLSVRVGERYADCRKT
jgi:hypothetical protein